VTIVADCARPELIREIKKAGYTIVESPKGSGSVKDGINMVKSFDLYLNGTNLVSEANKYVWRLDKNGDAMDEPVKQDDDIFDATRY
jgi:phage terminase large subunit